VVHKGIANRDFTLNFVLAEFHEVDGSSLRDGMLYITIYKEIPEEEKPKVIEIE
jgi:molecular chaperone IbpA